MVKFGTSPRHLCATKHLLGRHTDTYFVYTVSSLCPLTTTQTDPFAVHASHSLLAHCTLAVLLAVPPSLGRRLLRRLHPSRSLPRLGFVSPPFPWSLTPQVNPAGTLYRAARALEHDAMITRSVLITCRMQTPRGCTKQCDAYVGQTHHSMPTYLRSDRQPPCASRPRTRRMCGASKAPLTVRISGLRRDDSTRCGVAN
jgi:hypothetical protein